MSERAITPAADWRDWLIATEVNPFPAQSFRTAVVVAAHPDDETLGASGLLQQLHERGTLVSLVVATDGEAAFPDSSARARAELGRHRRRELYESLHAQGLGTVTVHWLALPDSDLAGHQEELARGLGALLAGADLVLAPWPRDPHPDHRVAGETALRVAPLTAHRWSYPIWMWHWLRPADAAVAGRQAAVHRLGADQRRRKAAGIAAFGSQLKPGPGGEEPILSADMLRHFERDTEVLFRQPPEQGAPISRFVQLYDERDDPWQVRDSWYERRKRAAVLASLPRERYQVAVEPACGIGVLTTALAPRCAVLAAFDAAPNAVRQASLRTAGLANVTVHIGLLPNDLPPGPVELFVFSEILYYLGEQEFADTVSRAVAALPPDGHLLAVHWLPWAPEAPRSGADTHQALLAHPKLRPLVEHRDEQFVLHVFGRR